MHYRHDAVHFGTMQYHTVQIAWEHLLCHQHCYMYHSCSVQLAEMSDVLIERSAASLDIHSLMLAGREHEATLSALQAAVSTHTYAGLMHVILYCC